ncbi:hypothetical protein PAECIP111891_06186 [Paenibacillus allorhizoplanae]|uniref:Uncharacterized protein n=1 Tax=Paenibacillus allorhizoplanae TaxID=2905648 RepID=A0ABM9CX60_9BACL|nr:hypothetical protein [Paenibacillus allorhizoplanae]CAH1227844.1 hypothetical protein PAECIP111891_06186 [Paenibacillus allorhizoplanae]
MQDQQISLDLALVKTYAPQLFFDRLEPFFPVRVGVTLFDQDGPSPSFRRIISFESDTRIAKVIEYAIYWDYDIEHLYELEHVWIYVGHDGSVINSECSFHGKFFKGLLKDRSNLSKNNPTQVKLYSQPGKHAFSPLLAMLDLVPNLHTCTYETAGSAGLLVPDMLRDQMATDKETNQLVERYLQTFRFRPTMEFIEFAWEESLFVPWPELLKEIPQRVNHELNVMRQYFGIHE